MANNADAFDIAVETVCNLFELGKLKEYQETFFRTFWNDECDFFVCQPTGSGKSLLFQALPSFWRSLYPTDCPLVLVISPLVALMKDQLENLEKKGVKACCFDEDNATKTDFGGREIVFASPESLLQKYRNLLKSKEVNARIIAVFIDESHCIEKWGVSLDKKQEAFRGSYSKLAELRSLFSKPVRFVAMTATAVKSTKEFIIDNLQMRKPKLLIQNPEKTNICYVVRKSLHDDCFKIFNPLVEHLREKREEAKRVIIFCRTRKGIRDVYEAFDLSLGDDYQDFTERPYAMFHSTTDDKIKEHIIRSFQKETGSVRILIATIAFGMGVDCKGLHYVIHYGPPSNLDNYFQESGRAGRDGKSSFSLNILFPRCFSRYTSKDIREYCNEKNECRRKLLLQLYNAKPTPVCPTHLCCDFCMTQCKCNSCYVPELMVDLSSTMAKPIVLNEAGENELRSRLEEIRSHIDCQSLSSFPSVSEFPIKAIDEIIGCCHNDFNETVLITETSIIGNKLYKDVLGAVNFVRSQHFLKRDLKQNNSFNDSQLEEINWESDGESESETECVEAQSDSD